MSDKDPRNDLRSFYQVLKDYFNPESNVPNPYDADASEEEHEVVMERLIKLMEKIVKIKDNGGSNEELKLFVKA